MAEKSSLWQGVRPLLGTIVGVGVFALPFAFSRVGFGLGVIELCVLALLSLVTFLAYAELSTVRRDKARFVAVIRRELGTFGGVCAAIAYFGSMWGSIAAYILVGGDFAHTIFGVIVPLPLAVYTMTFAVFGSLAVLLGSRVVASIQNTLIPLFVFLLVVLAFFALPHIDIKNLLTFDGANVALPVGVMFFALTGFSAVPESRDALKGRERDLPKAIGIALVSVVVFYVAFVAIVLGLGGNATSQEAVGTLTATLGKTVTLIASALGMVTVFTASLTLGNSVLHALLYDHRMRFIPAWLLTSSVPIFLYVLGARDFIEVIRLTGGIAAGLVGILLLLAYEKARSSAELPKHTLRIPQTLIGISFVAFVFLLVLTIAPGVLSL